MATRTYVTYVCDVCEAVSDKRYRIGFKPSGAPREVDLCTKHAKPIQQLEESISRDGRKTQAPTTTARKPRAKKPQKAAASKTS